ncbi:lytic murein transglycosylase [Tateyamaria sp. Alg231-49]|uniref:lytic murein transglycosylase n=1 Tax=Tateyamaria sp. Alg231-49 TaxID=1922219 RepID=UPI000D55E821|nr:lytic murein transglycosylase [Tateyamaria sp. Alg231-49]
MRWAVTFGAIVGALLITQSALAQNLSGSLRPEVRPRGDEVSRAASIPILVVPGPSVSRPKLRPSAVSEKAPPQVAPSAKDAGFQDWRVGLRARAQAQGIRGDVFDGAFRGVHYDPDVIKRDRNQSEFSKTIWEYLDSAASNTRVENGRAALRKHRRVLEAIEARYGVDKEVVVAVWGLESNYGTFRGQSDVIQSLATLAYDGRRGEFFEQQLIAALRILQSGDTSPREMTGSWAGAMGHTQFIPTSYLDYAVDFTGDGRRDIWSDDPTDALASTAAYLAKFGWEKGQPWGVEVKLPRNFDYALAIRTVTRTPARWARMGVVGMDGKAVSNHGQASILLPAGSQGVALMIFDNFGVIERYNAADAYVIGVGHLSDRIAGGSEFKASWPRSDRALTFAERQEMQQRLSAAGFDTQGVDGRIGPKTLEAVRGFQRAQGMTPDGYASLELLQRLR